MRFPYICFVNHNSALMKKIVFVLTTGILLSACSSEKQEQRVEKTNIETAKLEVNPNQLLTMEIDGMVCQMGCGGSIRKGLKETNGVASVEFEFEEERKTNVAKIAYDKSIVSSEDLIKIVSNLNEGQFLVGTISFEDMATPTKATKTSSLRNSEEPKVEVSSSYVKLPNLLDLFSGLLN
jgi:copper chaperone CopZ